MDYGHVSLRFFHPSADLAFLESELDLPCYKTWVAGSPRKTLSGEPWHGVNKESYWVGWLDIPSEHGFIEQITQLIERLTLADKTVRNIKNSGGRIEIYILLPGSINNGDSINSSVLKVMAEYGVDLLVEVYPLSADTCSNHA